MRKIKVWDLQTRVFHWSLVFSAIAAFVLAYLTADSDVWLGVHVASGAAVGILLTFRIFWGLAGSFYSRFSSFALAKEELSRYLNAVRGKQAMHYTGHNPATSWIAIAVIVSGLFAVLTGVVLFGIDEARGILYFLYTDFNSYAKDLKLFHFLLSCVLILFAVVHISGVLLETVRHRTGIIKTMVTGEKHSAEEERSGNVRSVILFASIVWLALPLPASLYVYNSINSNVPPQTSSPKTYLNECGSCHMAFPPNLLPKRSWQVIMSSLNDHFGEDAADIVVLGSVEVIDNTHQAEIEDFLFKNSAETSSGEASIKLLASMNKSETPLRITDIGYFKLKHDAINPEVFKRESVKNKSNCVACHKWAEYGSFEDNDIRVPK